MKKKIGTIILFLSVLFLNSCVVFATADKIVPRPEIKISVDGKIGTFKNAPLIINGVTLLPLREFLAYLGVQNDSGHICWNSVDKSVTAIKGSKKMHLVVGSTTAMVNDVEYTLDAAPVNYNNKVYIPARFAADSLGKSVTWRPDRIIRLTDQLSDLATGIYYTNNYRWEDALMLLDKILDQDPDNVSALIHKAKCLTGLSHGEEALECMNRALALEPCNYNVHSAMAKILEMQYSDNKAIDFCNSAIELNPDDYEIYYLKGICMNKTFNHKEAINCFDTAISLYPENERLYTIKAATLLALEKSMEALELCDKALEINARNLDAYLLKYDAYIKLGKEKEAADCMDMFEKLIGQVQGK